MSTESFKFPSTLPIDITFFNAESLSPQKLNNIFNYIKQAVYSLEMFIGNGVDYNIQTKEHKTLIGNLTNIIGHTAGNIYIPFNYLGTIESIYKRYCSTNGNIGNSIIKTKQNADYDKENDCLHITGEVNIPILKSFSNDVIFDIFFSISKDDGISDSNNAVSCIINSSNYSVLENRDITNETNIITRTNMADDFTGDMPYYTSYTISRTNGSTSDEESTFINYITLKNNNPDTYTFKIYAMSLYEIFKDASAEDLHTSRTPFTQLNNTSCAFSIESDSTLLSSSKWSLNSFTSIGLDHKSYITCKKPCKWSNRSYNEEGYLCSVINSDVSLDSICIGNTYDIYIDNGYSMKDKTGKPVCAGTYSQSNLGYIINQLLIPFESNDESIKLEYNNTYNGESSPNYMILQSPMNMYKNKSGSFKLHPFAITYQTDSALIEQGKLYIYNTMMTSGNPIYWDSKFFATTRADMVKIISSKIAVGSVNGESNKYLVISNDNGIAESLDSALNRNDNHVVRNIAVYGD